MVRFSLGRRGKVESCKIHHRNYYPHPATRYLGHRRFAISLDFPPSREENPAKRSTGTLPFRKFRMYQPPPLRGRSVFDDKKLLLIDAHQPTCKARASVFRSHGIGVDATDSLQVARTLWQTKLYDLILLDPRGYLPGEARDFYLEIKHANSRRRVVFLVGPPTYLSLTWPTEFMATEKEPQQWAETVKRLFNAA